MSRKTVWISKLLLVQPQRERAVQRSTSPGGSHSWDVSVSYSRFMKPLVISKTRFIAWLVATAIGFSLYTIKGEVPLIVGSLILCLSSFWLPPRSARRRRRTYLDFFPLAVVLLLGIVGILGISRVIPLHYGQMAGGALRHPGFLLPYWMLLVFGAYRRFQCTDDPSQSH